MKGEWRNRMAQSLANFILTRFTTLDYLAALYEVNQLGLEEYRKKRMEE